MIEIKYSNAFIMDDIIFVHTMGFEPLIFIFIPRLWVQIIVVWRSVISWIIMLYHFYPWVISLKHLLLEKIHEDLIS